MRTPLIYVFIAGLLLVCADESSAFAHAVCGARVFPATLGIDDPGVGDELALPTVTWLPNNSDGAQESSAEFNYSKTIFPHLAISIGDGVTRLKPGGSGWEGLKTEVKSNFLCFPDHEFMASAGFEIDWGTGTGVTTTPYNAYTPVLDLGMGFGDLPDNLKLLRPVAMTAEASDSLPGRSWTDGVQNPQAFNWGFTIQYSLPYYNANVTHIESDFLRRLVPITEFVFSVPIANFALGQNQTTGTIQPGVIYEADTWQFALEAVIPVNAASGHGVGVVGELHFFLDDILPNSLGKPMFGPNSLFGGRV